MGTALILGGAKGPKHHPPDKSTGGETRLVALLKPLCEPDTQHAHGPEYKERTENDGTAIIPFERLRAGAAFDPPQQSLEAINEV